MHTFGFVILDLGDLDTHGCRDPKLPAAMATVARKASTRVTASGWIVASAPNTAAPAAATRDMDLSRCSVACSTRARFAQPR
jgi:hypothetical protein